MSEKYENEQRIEERPRKAGVGSKLKRHCARFWWIHLIIFCVVFLIVALCLVYVAMPKIAQHDVDKASLELTDLQFLEPTSDTLVLTQKAILKNPSSFTPTLDAFNASFYVMVNGSRAEQRLTQLQLPEIHATKPRAEALIEGQLLNIDSLDQLTEFATQVLSQEEVENVLEGKTKLHLGALPVIKVKFYEVVKQKGLNGLKGFNVTEMRVNTSAPTGTPNFKGNAFIPNPSIMTIAMGNVTLTLSTEAQGVVGNATINNMTLRPGDNILPMTAFVEQGKLLQSLTDGKVDLKIIGKDAVYNGQHLTYYEKALASNELVLNMNVAQILKDSAADSGEEN